MSSDETAHSLTKTLTLGVKIYIHVCADMFPYTASLIILPIILLILIISFQRSHFLIILLRLEAITLLSTAYVALNRTAVSNNSPFLIIFLLTIGATEAGIGLALLVTITRHTGNDLVTSLTSLKC